MPEGFFVLVWVIGVMLPVGPEFTDVPEPGRQFKDFAACNDYAIAMTPRMRDRVRGRVRLDWDHPIEVAWICRVPGNDL